MFVIKIEDRYLEELVFRKNKPILKLNISKYSALTFIKKETAQAIINTIRKGELELL